MRICASPATSKQSVIGTDIGGKDRPIGSFRAEAGRGSNDAFGVSLGGKERPSVYACGVLWVPLTAIEAFIRGKSWSEGRALAL